MAEDSELWDVICDRLFVPMKTIGKPVVTVPKTRKEYNDADRKAIEKNFRAKKILICGIGPDEYNIISACQSAKEIWEALQMAHRVTTQVKQSKIDMLTTEYEPFRMKDDESIQDIESGEDDEQGDTSMMAVESEAAGYDSIFALMEKSNDD
ncbi:uncharacterized protein [Nicotiana tomentosiformis]|uniref:uncharacterized protein n=1 Tax=Nicotiana tomentosiformis TaxID=4098 RepID=UPI00051C7ED9|nr:uncharacterized protein LOC117274339 [Nicotiana tomentosiformis]